MQAWRMFVVALGMFGVWGGFVQELQAFRINRTNAGKLQHWDISRLPLPWWSNPSAARGISTGDAIEAWRKGMDTWALPSCSSFRSLYQGSTTATLASDKKNVLFFSPLSSFPSATLAVTTTTFDNPSGQLLEADIAFRNTVIWALNPTAQQFDLVATATHEIGHLLGFAHSAVSNSTMADVAARGPNPQRRLAQDDINAVCFSYPRGEQAYPGNGLPCGNQVQGAGCPPGYLCVARSGSSQAYCMSLCEQSACPDNGYCAKTTQGTEFCTCDSGNQCGEGMRCINTTCRDTSPPCRFDGDCPLRQRCEASKCVERRVGTCFADQDCPGRRCVNGLCPDVPLEPFQEPPSSNEAVVEASQEVPKEADSEAPVVEALVDDVGVVESTTEIAELPTSGCQCSQGSWDPLGLLWLLGFLMWWLRRR